LWNLHLRDLTDVGKPDGPARSGAAVIGEAKTEHYWHTHTSSRDDYYRPSWNVTINIKKQKCPHASSNEKKSSIRRTNGRADGRGRTTTALVALSNDALARGAYTARQLVILVVTDKTDERIAKQVPDCSASAGTGYWFCRIVVVDGGRQMRWRAGDDPFCAADEWKSGGANGYRVGVGGVGVGALRTTTLP